MTNPKTAIPNARIIHISSNHSNNAISALATYTEKRLSTTARFGILADIYI